jgi:hypothetical protein
VFGWGKWWSTANGVGNVYLWEGREAIAVIATNSAGGSAFGFIAGAILDPESSDTTVDGESDGRLYGIVRAGSSNAISGTFWTDAYNGNGAFGQNRFLATATSSNDGGPYNAVFSPGSASLLTMNPMMSFTASPSPTGLKTRSGMFGRLAITWRGITADNLLGRFREAYAYSDAQLPARQTDGANVIGYAYCGSSVAQVDSLLLEHA